MNGSLGDRSWHLPLQGLWDAWLGGCHGWHRARPVVSRPGLVRYLQWGRGRGQLLQGTAEGLAQQHWGLLVWRKEGWGWWWRRREVQGVLSV